jgi:hypothetical protein
VLCKPVICHWTPHERVSFSPENQLHLGTCLSFLTKYLNIICEGSGPREHPTLDTHVKFIAARRRTLTFLRLQTHARSSREKAIYYLFTYTKKGLAVPIPFSLGEKQILGGEETQNRRLVQPLVSSYLACRITHQIRSHLIKLNLHPKIPLLPDQFSKADRLSSSSLSTQPHSTTPPHNRPLRHHKTSILSCPYILSTLSFCWKTVNSRRSVWKKRNPGPDNV